AQAPEVEDRNADRRPRSDHLHRPAVHQGEGGAQGLVAADDLVESQLQRLEVERPDEAEGDVDVVGGAAGTELSQEPEALLREGERGRLAPGQRPELRHAARRLAPARRLDARGQSLDGGRFEEGAQREIDLEGVAQPGEQTGAEEGVAAQLEEVVAGTYLLAPQEPRPDLRHPRLGGGAGGEERALG